MPTAASYRWGVGISPVVVDLDLDVVARVRRELSRAEVIDGRAAEIGGLLIGSTHDDVVHVEDFHLVPSEHRRGASFCLSAKDRLGMRYDLAKYSKPHGLQVVGYFRSHTRPGLFLDENDHTVAREHFANPTQVFLLIRPDDPPQAGFFFWEGGEINRKQTYRSFPFDVAALASDEEAGTRLISDTATTARSKNRGRGSRSGLMLVPFAAGALAAVLIPWSSNRRPAEKSKIDKAGKVAPATSVPLFQGHSDKPAIPKAEENPPVEEPSVPDLSATEQAAPAQPAPLVAEQEVHKPSIAKMPVRRSAAAGVELEPARESAINRTIHRVPLLSKLHRYKAGDDFTPARPIHDPKPVVPNSIARELTRPVPVDVRLTVAKDGRVSAVLMLTKNSDAQLRDLVLGTATRWNFEPARIKGKPVDSQVVAHFRFEPRF